MSRIRLENEWLAANTVFCIGRNYVAHIAELSNEMPTEPLVFLKPNACLLNSGAEIALPPFSRNVHYEAELVLLIGEDANALTAENALSIVAGYGVGLDLTARDVQDVAKSKGLPWTKAKGFKGAACVSDFVAAGKIAEPLHTPFSFAVNGETRQRGDTALMIYPLPQILVYLAETYGLRRGDLVFTGTPEGVGKLNAGDKLALDLAGLVQAEFTVAAE
ncbi:MAG: fumarylacetoacetate hydrolase family protein [Neisseria sp.]|nr:fumarylacetoacetate hydrolase family protein [Neisseria sp.]